MLFKRILVGAVVLIAAACGNTATDTGDEVVSLTFDGTNCRYEGPAQAAEGTVDLEFNNDSDEDFAVAAISVADWALGAFLGEGDVGSDWDIPNGYPRSAGIDYHNRWPQVPPGESAEYSWTLPAGTYYLDCVLELDHVWRVARVEVVGGAPEAVGS